MGTTINGKELTTVSVEQIRALAEKIHEAKASAIGSMKEAFALKHAQGELLIQAEMELGDAFNAFVDGLADQGIDPNQARDNYRIAKKYKTQGDLLSQPGAIKQLMLRDLAPETPKAESERVADVPAYTITVRFNIDPMDAAFPRARFLAEPQVKSLVQVVQELEG
jgi:hypothetical protein